VNLVERAADVTLKECRPLILVPRETPLNLIHLDNLIAAARAGATIVPAMPAFYFGPQSLEDLADFIAGRVLSLLRVPHALFAPWKG
jgi:4-hydroxy-3-polyprenylbenzoate decarboxylase